MENINTCNFCVIPCKTRMECPLCDKNYSKLCEDCMNSHLEKHDEYLNNPHLLKDIYMEKELSKDNKSDLC